jgi:hypothetical protein
LLRTFPTRRLTGYPCIIAVLTEQQSGRVSDFVGQRRVIVADIPDPPVNRIGVHQPGPETLAHAEQLIGGRLSLAKPQGPFLTPPRIEHS